MCPWRANFEVISLVVQTEENEIAHSGNTIHSVLFFLLLSWLATVFKLKLVQNKTLIIQNSKMVFIPVYSKPPNKKEETLFASFQLVLMYNCGLLILKWFYFSTQTCLMSKFGKKDSLNKKHAAISEE